MLSDKLKHSIAELKRTYDEQVHHIRTTLSDQYEGSVEHTTVELEKTGLRLRQAFARSWHVCDELLQQKLDHSLWESRGRREAIQQHSFQDVHAKGQQHRYSLFDLDAKTFRRFPDSL